MYCPRNFIVSVLGALEMWLDIIVIVVMVFVQSSEFSASYSKRYREGMTLRPRGLSLNDLVHACDGVKVIN